jgi:hypothetical protein
MYVLRFASYVLRFFIRDMEIARPKIAQLTAKKRTRNQEPGTRNQEPRSRTKDSRSQNSSNFSNFSNVKLFNLPSAFAELFIYKKYLSTN